MESNIIRLGTRKLQYNNGALNLNVPSIAVRILDLKAGGKMEWTLSENTLQLRQAESGE